MSACCGACLGSPWVSVLCCFSYSNPDAIMMTNLSEVRLEEAEEEEREEEGEEELGVEEEVVEEEDGIETTCLLPLVGSRRY